MQITKLVSETVITEVIGRWTTSKVGKEVVEAQSTLSVLSHSHN